MINTSLIFCLISGYVLMAKAILVSGARQMSEIRFGCLGEEDKALKKSQCELILLKRNILIYKHKI